MRATRGALQVQVEVGQVDVRLVILLLLLGVLGTGLAFVPLEFTDTAVHGIERSAREVAD